MTHLNVSIPYNLSKSEAELRIKNFISKLKDQYRDVVTLKEERWNDGKCKLDFIIKGFEIIVVITIENNSVEIDSELPAALFLFRGSIKEKIIEETQHLLS